jgi:hypothetical protein
MILSTFKAMIWASIKDRAVHETKLGVFIMGFDRRVVHDRAELLQDVHIRDPGGARGQRHDRGLGCVQAHGVHHRRDREGGCAQAN